MLSTALLFIVILAILVLVHEFGHFIAAKKSGMKVEEFGFGFPPRLFGVQRIDGKFKFLFGHPKEVNKDAVVYSFNLIPLGGFVKILGENNDAAEIPGSFTSKAFMPRLVTLLAGVAMNFILAWVLISIGYMVGLPVGIDETVKIPKYAKLSDVKTNILEVDPDSPAFKAGLKPNDVIVSIDGKPFTVVEDVQEYIRKNRGKEFSFEINRGGKKEGISVKSIEKPVEGQGSVGISMVSVGKLKYPFPYAFYEGVTTTGIQVRNIFYGLYDLITSGHGLSSVGGPVKIAQLTGEVAGLGVIYLLQFTAFLSLNLGVLNSFPFPALDGGRVLFLLIEKVRGKKNNQKMEQYANVIGFSLLLLLMLVVTIKDIKGFF